MSTYRCGQEVGKPKPRLTNYCIICFLVLIKTSLVVQYSTLLFDRDFRMQIQESLTKCDSVAMIRWFSIPLTASAFALKLSYNK